MLQLKHVLDQSGIKQAALAAAIGISKTSLHHLITQNKWMKKQNPDALKNAIEAYLTAHNVALQCDLWAYIEPEEQGEDMQKIMISQAARQLFGVAKDPFTDDISSHEDIYLSADHRYIRETLYQAAKHGGFVAAIGESGAGKSVLRRDLVDRITRESQPITIISPIMPDKGRLTASSIEDAIIYDLDPNAHVKRSHEAKARQMQRLLVNSSRAGNSHCLVIEEAHDLTIPTLKQLKRFWEMEDGFKRLLSIVLIGQPELKNKLNERINYEAREVIRRCEIAELLPLDLHVNDYLKHKFERVGVDSSKVFEESAFDAMRQKLTITGRDRNQFSMTYPLVVNNLVVKAMNHAAELGANVITADIIMSA